MKFQKWISRLIEKPYFWSVLIVFAFGVVYATSLTFVYVEGDDATTILHHVLGRDKVLWPPYASYHSMVDGLLNLFPSNESLLRIFSISLSALAGVVFLILTLVLAFDWFDIKKSRDKNLIAIFSLLAIPELYFLGLIYDPSLIGITIILASHIMARNLPKSEISKWNLNLWIKFLISVVLFGLGVSFRWSLISYGLVVVFDLWFFNYLKYSIQKWSEYKISFLFGAIWGLSALAATLTWVSINGQAKVILGTFTGMAGWVSENIDFSLYSLLGLQSLFTPVAVIFSAFGFIQLIKQKRFNILIIVFASFLTILPSIKFGLPKMILTFIPSFIAMSIYGLTLSKQSKFRRKTYQRLYWIISIAILTLPWLIGIKIYSQDTLWGPGFEVRAPTNIKTQEEAASLVNVKIVNDFIPITGLELAINDGFAIATSEGPRPLGAYGKVLLGGGWRQFVNDRDQELQDIVDLTISLQKPILSDERPSLLIAKIITNGYSIVDAPPYWGYSESIYHYTFENSQGQTLHLFFQRDREELFDPTHAVNLQHLIGESEIPMYAEFTSTLSELFDIAPDAINVLSPFAAMIDLNEIIDNLR